MTRSTLSCYHPDRLKDKSWTVDTFCNSYKTYKSLQIIQPSTFSLVSQQKKTIAPNPSLAIQKSPIRPVWPFLGLGGLEAWMEAWRAGHATWAKQIAIPSSSSPSFLFFASPPPPEPVFLSPFSLWFLTFTNITLRWPFLLCPGPSRTMSSSLPRTRWRPPP